MSSDWAGPERRRFPRTPPPPPRVIGRARLRPEYSRMAGLSAGTWYAVLERPPSVLTPPLAGYCWIDLGGQPRHVRTAWLEIEDAAP